MYGYTGLLSFSTRRAYILARTKATCLVACIMNELKLYGAAFSNIDRMKCLHELAHVRVQEQERSIHLRNGMVIYRAFASTIMDSQGPVETAQD
jgi:hypothetical protein